MTSDSKVHIEKPHKLTREEVHRRVSVALDAMGKKYLFRFTRKGDVYSAKNAMVTGKLEVKETAVVADMDLGLAGLMLNLKSVLESEVSKLLDEALR
jgi:putative polyhydroxyalkanoate system protein